MDRDNAGMVEARNNFRFAKIDLHHRRIADKRLSQELDCDCSARASLQCAVDLSRRADADLLAQEKIAPRQRCANVDQAWPVKCWRASWRPSASGTGNKAAASA